MTDTQKTDHDLLIRIDERQEVVLEKVVKLEEHQEKQNGRIGKLENWRWYLGGLFIGAVAVIRFWPG